MCLDFITGSLEVLFMIVLWMEVLWSLTKEDYKYKYHSLKKTAVQKDVISTAVEVQTCYQQNVLKASKVKRLLSKEDEKQPNVVHKAFISNYSH